MVSGSGYQKLGFRTMPAKIRRKHTIDVEQIFKDKHLT